MPDINLINAYKKLYGITDTAEAERGIEQHISSFTAMSRSGDFGVRYYDYCGVMLKNAWTKNLTQKLNGEHLDRNPQQVAEDFADYMSLINISLAEKGIYNAPNPKNMLGQRMYDMKPDDRTLPEGNIEGWVNQWKFTVMSKIPENKVELEKFSFFGRDVVTDEKPSVKEALAKATEKVTNLCNEVSGKKDDLNSQKYCDKAVLALRAVEDKHASRSGFWKFFHPINNYREKKAIENMKNAIENAFSKEQIEAARTNSQGNADWVTQDKSDSIIPSQLGDIQNDVLNNEQEKLSRIAQVKEESQRAKEEQDIADDFANIKDNMKRGGDFRYNRKPGYGFVKDLDEGFKPEKIDQASAGYAEDVDEIENLFVSEAEDDLESEMSQPSEEKSAPEVNKNLQ